MYEAEGAVLIKRKSRRQKLFAQSQMQKWYLQTLKFGVCTSTWVHCPLATSFSVGAGGYWAATAAAAAMPQSMHNFPCRTQQKLRKPAVEMWLTMNSSVCVVAKTFAKRGGWLSLSGRLFANNGLRTLGGRAVNLDFQLDRARLDFSITSNHCARTDGHDGAFWQQKRQNSLNPKCSSSFPASVRPCTLYLYISYLYILGIIQAHICHLFLDRLI